MAERWAGRAFIAYGALSAVLSLIHPDQTRPGALADPLWIPVHWLGALTALIEVIGWLGAFGRYGGHLGRAAPLALVLVVASSFAGAADQLIEALLPARAQDISQQTVEGVRDALGWPLWPMTLVELAGLIATAAIALVLYRIAVAPRRAWLALALLMIGSPLALIPIAVAIPQLTWPSIVIAGVAVGACFVWIGTGMNDRAPTP